VKSEISLDTGKEKHVAETYKN